MQRRHSPESLTGRIEATRTWIVFGFALLVAVASLAFAVFPGAIRPPGSSLYLDLRLALLEAGLAAVAAVLTRRGARRWGARLLSASLLVIPTFLTLGLDSPYEPALAAYMGALMVTAAGSSQGEVLLFTVFATVLGLMTYVADAPHASDPEALVSIGGLLASTGIILSWLGDSLVRAVRQIEVTAATFHRLSHLDPLTGLGNRREFDENLQDMIAFCSAHRPVALVVIDVDNLKSINDEFGHPMGDQALRTVGESIRNSVRDTDIAARIGGDEFAIVLPLGGARGARRVAERIREILDGRKFVGHPGLPLSVSFGIAEARSPGLRADDLLAQADAELYRGRSHTRHPVRPQPDQPG
jgi:diguanylate cyclase (GGDEF)-like protein